MMTRTRQRHKVFLDVPAADHTRYGPCWGRPGLDFGGRDVVVLVCCWINADGAQLKVGDLNTMDLVLGGRRAAGADAATRERTFLAEVLPGLGIGLAS